MSITPEAAEIEAITDLVQLADTAGLELIAIQDHAYNHTLLDTWTLITFLAAKTRRIHFMPDVAALPLRPPPRLAKAVATLDQLTDGRAELAMGAGAFWDAIAGMGGPRRTPAEAVGATAEAREILRQACAGTWAREYATTLQWLELSLVKWVADLGVGPVSPAHPDVVGRRLLVRSTGARHRRGYTAIVTDLPPAVLPTQELEPFDAARQTSEGWLSKATAALQLTGLWSRSCWGLSAFLRSAALASNLLNWWLRRALRPLGQPLVGLRQLIGRVIALPASI